jgi:methionyl-tRNA formyltransferase
VAYGEIIKKSLLEIPKMGCVNIHASLLPKYRGAAPMQRCLMNGDVKTGITLIEMTPEMDAGDILDIESIDVPLEMNLAELKSKLEEVACRSVDRFLTALQEGRVKKTPQDTTAVTFAPKILPEESRIDWGRPASAIHNQIRALSPAPGAWCEILIGTEKKRLKILRSYPFLEGQGAPGEVLQTNKHLLVVACREGAIKILEVQLEGKKPMKISDFVNGLRQPLKTLF